MRIKNSQKIIFGRLDNNGNVLRALGGTFIVEKGAAGLYTLKFEQTFALASCFVTPNSSGSADNAVASVYSMTSSSCIVKTFNPSTLTAANFAFSFMAVGK